MRWPSRTGITTTEVSCMLFSDGLVVSRDRLYKMADQLFVESDMRPNGSANRRFTQKQFAVLRAGFLLQYLTGATYTEVAEQLHDTEALATTMREAIDRIEMSIQASLPGLDDALACVSIHHGDTTDSPTAATRRHVA